MPQFNELLQQPSIAELAGQGISGIAQPDRGLVGNIIHELGLDVLGTGRVVGATAGELAGLLGFAVPLTYEDLSSRDVKGAMMMAALGAGGLAGGAVRGALSIPATAMGRAGATMLSEAAAGAAFGLVTPLEDDQSRLGAVAGNAALSGAVGMGASFIKTAAKATIGARIAGIKALGSRSQIMRAAKQESDELMLREMAGVRLRNPTSNEQVGIRTLADGKVVATVYDIKGKTVSTSEGSDFGTAVAEAVRNGFNDDLRPYDPMRMLAGVEERLDARTIELLAKNQGNITESIGLAEIAKYKAVRQAAELNVDFRHEITALTGDVIAPANMLGVPQLNPATKDVLLKELKITGPRALTVTDSEIIREAARQGLVDIGNITDAAALDNFMSELFINDAFSVGMSAADITINKHRDAILTSVLLPERIAKFFPEVAPVVKMADVALQGIERATQANMQWLFDLKQRVAAPNAVLARDLIHNSVVVLEDGTTDVVASRAAALQAAAATGNAEIVDFVNTVVPKLEEVLTRYQAEGVLKEGISGYFPIVNANKWKLDITDWSGEGKLSFQGFWDTEVDALAEVERLRATNPRITAMVSPRGFTWDRGHLTGVEPVQLGNMRKALVEAYTTVVGPEAAREMAEDALRDKFFVKAAAPLRGTPHARKRVLGLHDFSADPFDALDMYLSNSERTLALRSFERLAKPMIDILPDSQSNLKAWGEQFIADILGKPRPTEKAFDALMDHLGLDVKPRALRRYTSALRNWESFSRLGGFWSGIVNLTQIPLNTFPVLGARYTARGMEALLHPKEATATLLKNGVDLGMFVPFSEAGEGARMFFGGPAAAFKEKRYVEAAQRIGMYVFNGAERVNRLVTAWGAFQQGVDAGIGTKAAAAAAQSILERTQFNYRMSNMPTLLRGPIGALMLQFKSFVINEIDFISSLSPKEAMRFGQSLTAMGGISMLFNMPGPDIAANASLLWSHEKLDEKLHMKANDSMAWRAVAFGLPGVVGVNLSDHIGVGNIADITSGILGPFGKDALALSTFMKNASVDYAAGGSISDDTKRAFLQVAMPSTLRRLQRGYDIAHTGNVRAPYTGKLLYQPENRLREAWLTAVGAPTMQLSYEQTANVIVERQRAGYVRAHSSFAKEMALAIMNNKPEVYQQTLQEANAAGHMYTGTDITRWVREMRKPAAERRQQRTPRALRQDLMDLFDLTGTVEVSQGL
jgi:hypothetical protein